MPISAATCGPSASRAMGAYVGRGKSPQTAQLLYNYALGKLRAGQTFYISPTLNSSVFRNKGQFGDVFSDLFTAASGTANDISSIVVPAAQIAGSIKALSSSGSSSSGGSSAPATGIVGTNQQSDQVAAQILPNVVAQLAARGITLPSSVAQQTVSASIFDAFGSQYHNIVEIAALALGGFLLFKLIRKGA